MNIAKLLLLLSSLVSITSAAPELWEPRSFSIDELMLFERRLSVRQELISTGVIKVNLGSIASNEGRLFIESTVDMLVRSVVENFELATEIKRDVRLVGNSLPRQAEDKYDRVTDISTLHTHDGIISSIFSRNECEDTALLDIELSAGGVVRINVSSSEVLLLVGKQWTSLSTSQPVMSTFTFPREIPYHVVKFAGFCQRIHHDRSLDDVVSRVTRTSGGNHNNHMHSVHNSMMSQPLGMDMDDDMDNDSFCSGSGMTMNMDGFGISFGNSGRSCLNYYFERWTLDTNGKFVFAMISTMCLGMLAEYFPRLKRNVYAKTRSNERRRSFMISLHVLHLALGYICMLAAMTYSFEIFLFLLVGFGIGFTLFGYSDEIPVARVDPCCVENNLIPENVPLLTAEHELHNNASVHHIE